MLVNVRFKFDAGILIRGRQFVGEVGGNFTVGGQSLIASRVRIALQIEQRSFIREDVLYPGARRKWMRSCLVHDGNIRASDGTITWNDHSQIWFSGKRIAEAQSQVVPHNTNRNLALGDVGQVRLCWRKVSFLLQGRKVVDSRMDIAYTANLC